MNNITIAGPLGRDSELRAIQSGDQVLSFSVADSAGRDKPTIWWNCQLWGKRAATLQQYLNKGQSVTVSGSVSERKWVNKDGIEQKSMEIRVADVALHGGRPAGDAQAPKPAASKPAPAGSGFDDMGDDIPF